MSWRTISKFEKKDKGLNEPVQFYTGKDNMLFELVVNNIDKNMVKGYISTPKNAPKPVYTLVAVLAVTL